MKKFKILISVLLLCIVTGIVTAYGIYGHTLIDITNEKSIINHLSADKSKPITIIDTKQTGNWFGVLYTDPLDEDEGYYHFKYITKAKFYKNHYHNAGGNSRFTTDETTYFELNNMDENRLAAEVFLFGSGRNYDKKLSVFEYSENTNKYKKIEKIEVPEEPYIMARSYKLEESSNTISIQDELSYVDNLIK